MKVSLKIGQMVFLVIDMIVKLCNSVFEAIKRKDSNTECFIEDLLNARRNGFISILLSKRDILFLLDNLNLTNRQKAILKFDKEKSTYINSKLRSFNESVVFYHPFYGGSVGDYDISKYRDNLFDDILEPLGKANVIFENKDDDLVYRKILEWYLKEVVKSIDLQLSYTAIHGGGHTTASLSEELINKKIGLFTVCDSDKISPYSEFGKTAKDTIDVFNSMGLQSRLLCIEAHEVENLVPITFHNEVSLDTQKPSLEFIKKSEVICSDSYIYYDFKDSFKVSLLSSKNQCGNYWNDIVQAIGFDVSDKSNSDKIVGKLSSMVKHSIKLFNESKVITIPDNESLYNEWIKIGSFLLPKVIASKPYRM